jgi:hypothetical protein
MADLVAVVDLGSTAVRFLVAEIVPDSGYRVLVEERVPTGSAGGRPTRCPARPSIGRSGPYTTFARGIPRTAAGPASWRWQRRQ